MVALDESALLQLGLGHSTETHGPEVVRLRLDAQDAAELFVAIFLPLGDQVLVGVLLLEQIVVQFLGNLLLLVVQLVDVSRALVVDFEDFPDAFDLALAVVRLVFDVSHLILELLQALFDFLEAFWRLFGSESDDSGHRVYYFN